MYLAQVNVARMKAPPESRMMADFMGNLDRINALAERHDGFIWRLTGEGNDATSIRIFEDQGILINLSVWRDITALYNFVYRSDHALMLIRKGEWFKQMKEAHLAMWYIDEKVKPTVEDARERLAYLRVNGETPYAFTFRKQFRAADVDAYLEGR